MLLILAAALAVQNPAPLPRPSPVCQEARRVLTGKGEGATYRKLGELPPARSFAAVVYHDGECMVPVPIRGERVRRR